LGGGWNVKHVAGGKVGNLDGKRRSGSWEMGLIGGGDKKQSMGGMNDWRGGEFRTRGQRLKRFRAVTIKVWDLSPQGRVFLACLCTGILGGRKTDDSDREG